MAAGLHTNQTATPEPGPPDGERPHPLTPQRRLAVLLATMAVSVGTYTSLNLHLAGTSVTRTLETPVDALVPLDVIAMLPYGGIYAIALTPACLITDRRLLDRCAVGYLLLLALALPIWLLWPVTVPRGPAFGNGLLDWGLTFVRWMDPPTNCFPSMHVAETVLAAWFCWRMDRRVGAAVGALALSVWWSTMALDQHWFLDGLVGGLLAVLVGVGVLAVRPLPAVAFAPGPRRHLLWAAALYVAMFVVVGLPWALGWASADDLRALTP